MKKYFKSIRQYADNSGVLSVKIKFFVSSLAALVALAGSNVLSAQDVIILKNDEKIKTGIQKTGIGSVMNKKLDNPVVQPHTLMQSGDRYMPDTTSRQLRYSHNFQSGIPALDNYLDIKILDGTGKKLKKSELRSIFADVPEALDKYNSGVRLYTAAAVLGIASIGILAVRLSKPDNKYLWMSVGIGCSTGVVICRLVGTSKLKSAMNINNRVKTNLHTSNLSLNFGVPSSGGLGLMLNF
jgi:hypothetical protein